MRHEPTAPRPRATPRATPSAPLRASTAAGRRTPSRTVSQTVRWAAPAVLAASALLASPALAQDKPPAADADDPVITINPSEKGWSVLDLFSYVHKVTGRSILYDDQSNTKLKQATVKFVGAHTIRRSELFDWLQAVLSFNGLILVPVGPDSPEGVQQWFCLDQNNAAVKTKPVYVDEKDIYQYADRDGYYIVTTFTLQHISDVSRVRQALQTLITQQGSMGRITDVQGSRSVIVGDFAPVVVAMKRLLAEIDKDNPTIEPQMEVIELRHAVATELGPIIQDLIQSSDVAQRQRPQQQGQADADPEPKIIPDDRLDALIIYATEKYMVKIKRLIADLDRPSQARGKLHFRALKHTDAKEMAGLLDDLIDGTSTARGGSTTTGSRTGRTNRTPAPQPVGGQAGGAAFGTSAAEGRPVIIPDPKTNSLIIHASPTQRDSIFDLIDMLDVSRPQVLIETALVELALSDTLTLGAELFSSQNGIAVDANNDGTPDAITNDRKGFSGTSFGLSDLVTVDVGGVKVPVNRSPILGSGLTAGIFNNGKLAATISAVESNGRAKILTRPSIVANDNEKATIRLSRETSYRENVRSDTGQDRDNFRTVTADTELTISPHISSDSFLRLEIEQKVANFGNRPSPDAPPDKTERTITTNVTIPDAYTVVLGGLIQEEESTTVSKVPFLGDIPVLGLLFRQSEDKSTPAQLFLFVTPRILRDMNGFRELHDATWERKLLQDDLFEGVQVKGTRFRGPSGESQSPAERADALGRSGALDGAVFKAGPTDEERKRMALDAYERARREAPPSATPATPADRPPSPPLPAAPLPPPGPSDAPK